MSEKENPRARQLGQRIREIVAEAIEFRVKDPRLGFITITDARLTNDLREATVFYTVFGDEKAHASTADALADHRGQIRTEVGRRLGIKHTPSLKFLVDTVPETASHLEELLRKMRAADAELAELSKHAQPAGDPDPYKHDHDEEDEA